MTTGVTVTYTAHGFPDAKNKNNITLSINNNISID